MALLDFIKDAGERLFHSFAGQAAQPANGSSQQSSGATQPWGASQPSGASAQSRQQSGDAPPQSAADKANAANNAAADAILAYIKKQNLDAAGLTVTYDTASSTATVYGVAHDQATKEKIALCCGNVAGVAHVDDRTSVDQSAPAATFYTVKSGDTLSKIAKHSYGDADQYMKIFEANRPMLASPDKIYPGQTLRIPPAQV